LRPPLRNSLSLPDFYTIYQNDDGAAVVSAKGVIASESEATQALLSLDKIHKHNIKKLKTISKREFRLSSDDAK
jgi:hypothetical protein